MKNIINKIHLSVSSADLEELGPEWNTGRFDLFQRCIPWTRIYMPLEGTGLIQSGNRKITLQRGKIVLIPPFSKVFVSCNDHLVKYWSHFNAFWGEGDSNLFSFLPGIIEHTLQENELSYFSQVFERVRQSFRVQKPPEISEMEETCAISALMLILEPFLQQVSQTADPPQIERLFELIQYMNNHINENLSLPHLAAKVKLNPCYLVFLFRKAMGISPIAYLSRLRVERAMFELRKNSLRINEVAESVGFYDPAVFCRFFKRFTGMSPSAYQLTFLSDKDNKNRLPPRKI